MSSLREHMLEVQSFAESELDHLDAPVPPARLGRVHDSLCANLRTLAGCALLLDGDIDLFCARLVKSGLVRAQLLAARSSNPTLRNPYLATGNSRAFFDVMAARDFDLARRLATLSPAEHWPGEEYEEDFCYAHLFHQLVHGVGAGDPTARATLDRLGATDGSDGPRHQVCEALLASEQGAFDAAFSRLLDARGAELAEAKMRFWPDGQIGYRVQARIYVEALAILACADARGLTTAPEYEYCPKLARTPTVRPFPTTLSDV